MSTALERERQVQAETALRNFALEVTVVLNPGDDLSCIGSGVLMHRSDGTLYILTAAHIVEGPARPISIWVSLPRPRSLRDAVKAVHLGPERAPGDRIDVALLELTDDAQSVLRDVGAPSASIAIDDMVSEEDFVFMTGYPGGLMAPTGNVRMDSKGLTVAGLAVVNLFFITKVQKRDAMGRMWVSWGDGVSDNDRPAPPHIPWKEGERVDMGAPNGVSGAGLWRCRKPPVDEVWSPRKHAQLIGINSAWNRIDREIVEPTSLWRDWFEITERSIAPYANPSQSNAR